MSKFICDFPWIHFSVFPQGNCTICCVAKHSGENNGHSWNKNLFQKSQVLTVTNNSIEEIVNCDNYKQIRLDMISGKVPNACEGCHGIEQNGGTSKRQFETNRNLDHAGLTNIDGSINVDLRHIELRLGNYCNLKCRSCNADSSTSWIKDYYTLKDRVDLASGYHWIKSNPIFDFEWTENEDFYNNLIDSAPNLEQIHISGGEPFLVPKHFTLLEKLVKEKRTNIEIHYHTNLNYNFEKIKKALDLLTNFKAVHMSFSIDDVGDRNSYIRSLSDWDLMIKNLRSITENYKFIFRITQTVSAYNFMYLEELTQYLKKENINVPLKFNHIHSPDYLIPTILPKHIRQHKIDSIIGKISDFNYHDLFGHYYNADDNGRLDYFRYFTNELDLIRNEKFEKDFSLLIKAIDER